MKIIYIPVALTAAFIVFSVIHKISRQRKPLKRAFLSVLSGIGALVLVDVLSVFTLVYIPVSVLSIIISGVLGIPGVTAMLCYNLILSG